MKKNDELDVARTALKESLNHLEVALALFDQHTLNAKEKQIYFDAIVKRFEVAFEYCWKFMQRAVIHEGKEAYGPRQAIQEAIRFGWINDPEFWADALEARNGSVHNYFSTSLKNYLDIVQEFLPKAKKLPR